MTTPAEVAGVDSGKRMAGDLISELEAESARWSDERNKVERGDEPNIGTAICDAKANAYADAGFRVKRAFGIAPPDACGFRSAAHPSPKSAESKLPQAGHVSPILSAYAETCRHIEALERIQAGSPRFVLLGEANARARLLLERILER